MRISPRFPLLGVLFVMTVLAAACGQKPGVARQAAAGAVLPPGATVNEQGQIVDAQGNVIGSAGDPAAGAGSAGIGPASGVQAGAPAAAGNAGAGGSGSVGGRGQSAASSGSNSTGVTDTTIRFGAHAPLTGAAPVPTDSAQKGADLHWKWLKHNDQKINGRDVESILKNDNYNPSQAVAVCKEMVEKEKVFLLTGIAGTDQIQACARYAASVGVPYLSGGVTENGLTDLYNYFALSMTYAEQGPLLADMLVTKLGAKSEKNGMLRFDTPNFQDAHDAFIAGMNKMGAEVVYDRAVSKGSGTAEAQTVVQEMKAAGIENVNVLVSPVWFLQVLKAADTQNYHPQWVGVGITKAFDTVANVGCKGGAIDKARFFSPFPAWIDIDRFDPDFNKAMKAIYPEDCNNSGCGDDFVLAGYTASRQVEVLLREAGRNLTREGFIASTERVRNLRAPGTPEMNFSPTDHFGAHQVHVNEARCSDNRFHTIQAYVSDF